jgi:hypothetical protein
MSLQICFDLPQACSVPDHEGKIYLLEFRSPIGDRRLIAGRLQDSRQREVGTQDVWLTGSVEEALECQRPLSAERLEIVETNIRADAVGQGAYRCHLSAG